MAPATKSKEKITFLKHIPVPEHRGRSHWPKELGPAQGEIQQTG